MSKNLNIKKVIIKGGLVGLISNFVLPLVLGTIFFSGQCGFSFLDSAGRTCTYFEALISSDGFVLLLYIWFTLLWWVVLIIFLLSILGTYMYYKRRNKA